MKPTSEQRLIADLEAFGLSEMPAAMRFFEPNGAFFEAMQAFDGLEIVDVGAGQGHVAQALRDRGHDAMGIDLRGIGETEYPVTWGNARTFNFAAGSVVLICRPCHSDFVESAVDRAIARDVSAILYVGFEGKVANDIGERFDEFRKFDSGPLGASGERLWIRQR